MVRLGRSVLAPLAFGCLAAALAGCSSSHEITAEWFLGQFTPGTRAARVVVARSACEHYGHTDYSGDASATQVVIIYKADTGACTAQLEVSELTLNLPIRRSGLTAGVTPRSPARRALFASSCNRTGPGNLFLADCST